MIKQAISINIVINSSIATAIITYMDDVFTLKSRKVNLLSHGDPITVNAKMQASNNK